MEFLSYFVNFLAVVYWLFRVYVVVAMPEALGSFASPSFEIEKWMLIANLIFLVGIFARNLFLSGGLLAMYFAFYGYGIYNIVQQENITSMDQFNILVFAAGIIIALLCFLDVLFNKARKGTKLKKNVDWFYSNDKYDREYDERADRNQYKIR